MRNDELVGRIEILERRLARQRWVHALVLLVAATSIGVGAKMQDSKPAIAEVVRTRKLEVVDASGRARVVVESDAGTSTLRFIDNQMVNSIFLRAEEGKMNSLELQSVKPGVKGFFRVSADDSFIISSLTSPGSFMPSVTIGTDKDGSYLAQFVRQCDKQKAYLPNHDDPEYRKLAESFAKSLEAAAKSFDSAIILSPSANGGNVSIHNKTGETTSTLRVDEYGNGVIGVWDRKGIGRTLTPGK